MTISNGQVADATEVLNITKIYDVYTGSSFDAIAGTGSTVSASYEFPAIPAGSLINANYLESSVFLFNKLNSAEAGAGDVKTYLKIEAQAIGGSYVASLSEQKLVEIEDAASTVHIAGTYNWIHTLTANEKTNGVQLKFTGKTVVESAGTAGSLLNIQTSIEVKP